MIRAIILSYPVLWSHNHHYFFSWGNKIHCITFIAHSVFYAMNYIMIIRLNFKRKKIVFVSFKLSISLCCRHSCVLIHASVFDIIFSWHWSGFTNKYSISLFLLSTAYNLFFLNNTSFSMDSVKMYLWIFLNKKKLCFAL